MKINLLLISTFISVIIFAEINFETGHVGLTRLNGVGCLCHGIEFTDSVHIWIEGPDSLEIGQLAIYTIYITGGPSVKGGFNVAAFSGILNTADSSVRVSDNELTHTFAKQFSSATVFWEFEYTAPNTLQWDTLYSVGNSVNGDGIPFDDQWNFGENLPVKIVEKIIPVEFVSFNSVSDENTISLTWTTATETINYGFEVQRSTNNLFYSTIGFVPGFGTTTESKSYTYKIIEFASGTQYYRLKQIDFDGTYKYSEAIELEGITPVQFTLFQNYPNPFNPATSIKFSIPVDSNVKLKLFNMLGQEVAELLNSKISAGIHQIDFNASSLSSGTYFYALEANVNNGNNFNATKKMIFLR
ncbi:MAG: T9SS type A sorting domain-containing protein [Ignavibacteria bacterium]|nr:T9SS type A sorting domain-containing protein [Ignavibacteria bacterium]